MTRLVGGLRCSRPQNTCQAHALSGHFWVLHLIHGRDRAGGKAPVLQGLWGRVQECIAMPAGLLVIVHGPPCQGPASLGSPTPPVCLRTPSGPLQASDRQGLAAYCHLVC